MNLFEATKILTDYGYLLTEWKITSDFDELSADDKKTLTRAMNGAYTARKSENKANMIKYSTILKNIATKLKNPKAIKQVSSMINKMSGTVDTSMNSTQTIQNTKSTKTTKIQTIKVELYTAYGFNDRSSNFNRNYDKLWNLTEEYKKRLMNKYNGTSIADQIEIRTNTDHDGNEGYANIWFTLPEQDAVMFKKEAEKYDSAKIIVHSEKEATNTKTKKKSPMRLKVEQYDNTSIAIKLYGLCRVRNVKKNDDTLVYNKSEFTNNQIIKMFGNAKTAPTWCILGDIDDKKFIKMNATNSKYLEYLDEPEKSPAIFLAWLSQDNWKAILSAIKKNPNSFNLYTSDSKSRELDIRSNEKAEFLKEWFEWFTEKHR